MKQLIVAIIILTTASGIHAASFDCKKAATLVEKSICAEKGISDLDNLLMLAYKKALHNAVSDSLKSQQRAWLASVRNKCQDTICLKRVYNEQITLLNSIGAVEKTTAESEDGVIADIWMKVRSNASKEVQDLLNQADKFNEDCRGGAGDDPKTDEACEKREDLHAKINKLDWCWGNGSENQFGYQMYWQHCNVIIKLE